MVVTKNPLFAMHFCLAMVPIWLAGNLLFFNSFTHIPGTFAWFNAHGSCLEWSGRFALLGAVGSIGLVINNRWARLLSVGTLGVGHAMIACGFYLSNAHSLSLGTYIIWAILAAWRIALEK